MNATKSLHDLGQSLWLDNITRGLLRSGGLTRYINEFAVTGLTSNPTIFAKAFQSGEYDDAVAAKRKQGKGDEELFFELAAEDLGQAAKAFRPVYDLTNGIDGWVSLEVSPLLAHDKAKTIASAKALKTLAVEPNVFIKIPGTSEGLGAIEEAIFAGIPVNVTLLFSREQYVAAAEAYLRGVERRVAAGLNPKVASVASVFVSRWDVAVEGKVPADLKSKLGIAIGQRTYVAYRKLLASPRWERLANLGAQPQRLLWASTGTKDKTASDLLYVDALAAPFTVNTMPEGTLKALSDHGKRAVAMAADGADGEAVLAKFAKDDVDVMALAAKLQTEGAESFAKSWQELMSSIAAKGSGKGSK